MYEPLEVVKCKKCGKLKTQSIEHIRIDGKIQGKSGDFDL